MAVPSTLYALSQPLVASIPEMEPTLVEYAN
jgi:hypothetical protein